MIFMLGSSATNSFLDWFAALAMTGGFEVKEMG